MLILLPPSESKRKPPDSGHPVQLEHLSFPQLNPTRLSILEALIETSSRDDALERLYAGARATDEVLANRHLLQSPVRPAIDTYQGPLYEALDPASMSVVMRRRAETRLIIFSALWGALRPRDRIPAYRMHVCSRLVGISSLEPMWRSVLGPVLAEAVPTDGVVVDLRSPSFRAVGTPAGLEDRTVIARITRPGTTRSASPYQAKYTRGEIARHLLTLPVTPHLAHDLPDALADRWKAHIGAPSRAGEAWTMNVETTTS